MESLLRPVQVRVGVEVLIYQLHPTGEVHPGECLVGGVAEIQRLSIEVRLHCRDQLCVGLHHMVDTRLPIAEHLLLSDLLACIRLEQHVLVHLLLRHQTVEVTVSGCLHDRVSHLSGAHGSRGCRHPR